MIVAEKGNTSKVCDEKEEVMVVTRGEGWTHWSNGWESGGDIKEREEV